MTPVKYPFGPLAAAMGVSENQALVRLAISGRTGQEYRYQGMSEKVADRMAVKAGLHPFEVWPDMAEHQIDAAKVTCPECGGRFLPTRKGHTYCSKACRNRRRQRLLYRSDEGYREARKAAARALYEEVAPYRRRQMRERHWANRDAELARMRARYRASRQSEVA